MIRTPALTLLAIPLLACVNDPVATTPSNNADVRVDELFTHDGCTVYRFRDGAYHYYVRCKGEPAVRSLSCLGKGCNEDDSIPTLESAAH
jgi:hypothetical protein